MRGTSAEETLHAKESYEHLKYTHRDGSYTYMAENGRFAEPLFKEAGHTCGQLIRG